MNPLYDHLLAKARRGEARFHMPGHKGVPVLDVPPELLDFTELSDTGDLYAPDDDIIAVAERLAAADYRSNACLFSAGGATLCIQAAMAAACAGCGERGARFLAARDAHRSFFHALALLDATAQFLPTFSSADVFDIALSSGKYDAVYITSPNYYGTLADTDAVYDVCKHHGVPLIIDAAHGAHLEWLGIPIRGDYVVMSAHKTLQALGGAAMLHTYGVGDAHIARYYMKIFGTSSPSYLILASLDRALGLMRTTGTAAVNRVAARAAAIRTIALLPTPPRRDPLRLVRCYADGFAVARQLEQLGVIPEMADCAHVVFILTAADSDASLDRLAAALERVTVPLTPPLPLDLPPLPEQVMSPRAALFAAYSTISLDQAAGRIAAAPIAPYPPGVPIIAPGEKISHEHIAFLREILYNSNVNVVTDA